MSNFIVYKLKPQEPPTSLVSLLSSVNRMLSCVDYFASLLISWFWQWNVILSMWSDVAAEQAWSVFRLDSSVQDPSPGFSFNCLFFSASL